MTKNIFLNKKWKYEFLEKIKKKAGPRYTPELNVELPITEVFDGISRNKNFYFSIRKHRGKLIREFNRLSSKYDNKELQELYSSLRCAVFPLIKLLGKLKTYTTQKIPWDQIALLSRKGGDISLSFSDKLRNAIRNFEQQTLKTGIANSRSIRERYSSDIHYLYQVENALQYFQAFAESTTAKLSNAPFLLLIGSAGTGKTHLLCDLIDRHVTSGNFGPALLAFGEFFVSAEAPLGQIIRQIGLRPNTTKFLRYLNNAGRKSDCRALLIVDALNETNRRNFWKNNLGKLVADVKNYPNLALVISVRSGFEAEVLAKKHKKCFVHEAHQGFRFREWEAVTKFFGAFNLPLPEIPLLMPEFQNPLFLLLFCKAFQKRTKRNQGQRQKQIFRGHEGATYIFETFVDSVSKRISKQFSIPMGSGKNIWDTVIEKIAAQMVVQSENVISESGLIRLVKKAYPSIDPKQFIKELERDFLLVKIPRYSVERKGYDGFDYRFPFQKFSDHLLGRYLFKRYEDEFGKTNKNLETARKFFSKRRKLGKYISQPWSFGIVETLSIQCPEHLKGCEFIEVAPYLQDSHLAKAAFIESLIWRKPEAFSPGQKNTLNYINKEIIKTKHDHNNFLNALLSVAPLPNHPFNADFLHKYLCRFPMPIRDSWWSTFLHFQYGEKGAVDRLIEWAWSEMDRSNIKDEAIRLCSVAMLWFLTTSNRYLRDKSTKALIALLNGRLMVALALLKQFRDVNDPYVSERLYAVAYGCALRSRKDTNGLKDLSQWVYHNVFQNENLPVHIFTRDYARGIIEVAIAEKLTLRIRRKRITPPYNSSWPNTVPSEKSLRQKFYPDILSKPRPQEPDFMGIWSSVMHDFGSLGDFGRYVLNSAVGHWSGRKLKSKEVSRKLLLEKFKRGLTKQQKQLLEKATNPFWGINFSEILDAVKFLSPDDKRNLNENQIKRREKEQKRKMNRAFSNFENSLSPTQKTFYKKEILPYIDNHARIIDPLENFNTGLAQRWVFTKVIKLGWNPKLHGEFDKFVKDYQIDRSPQKAERIGKKYQWIALHELLARISDNFQFKETSMSNKTGKYNGPWQLSIRDIDPSCILKEFPNASPEGMPTFPKNKKQDLYNAWSKRTSNSTWIKKKNDLPDPKNVIELTDDAEIKWLALEGFANWEEETPPELESYDLPTRNLFYLVKGYLVRKKDKEKVFNWAKKQNFIGRWMTESHEFRGVFLAEYPWAPAFLYFYVPYYSHHRWTDGSGPQRIPGKILVLDDQYMSSGSSTDCSTNNPIRVKLPAKFLIDEMKLVQKFSDGRFFDSHGNLVAFDPNVFNANTLNHVLIRKEIFCSFLTRKGYAILWTLLGEKNMLGGSYGGSNWIGRLELSGAYTLNNRNKLVGRIKSNFKSPSHQK